jgi:hypothetical protein
MPTIKKSSPAKKGISKAQAKPIAPKPKATKAVAIKKDKPLTDVYIDIEAFNLEQQQPAESKSRDLKAAKSACPQGKQSKVTRDSCRLAPPQNKNLYITLLHVTLSTQTLKVTWSNGNTESWLCSPNPSLTPKGKDVVGVKCGAKHTNYKRDGMAWFTAFKSRGMAYGFHNSQPVGLGIKSHGCVRVSCEHAQQINLNSWSGITKIEIVR